MHNTFKYPKTKLLDAVKANRERHQKNYFDAMTKYREKLVDVLTSKLEVAKAGEPVSHRIDVVQPVEYLAEYDRAIMMFEMTVEEEIELDAGNFAQLVMDEWHWKDSFNSTTMSYNK